MSNTTKLTKLIYLLFLNSPKKRNRLYWGIGAAAFIILPQLIPISFLNAWKNLELRNCFGWVCRPAKIAANHPLLLGQINYVFAFFVLLNILLFINVLRWYFINRCHIPAEVMVTSTFKLGCFFGLSQMIVYLSVCILYALASV